MAVGLNMIEKSLDDMEKEVTCAICQELYTDPKILPCLHYYCKQCILQLSSRAGLNRPFSCPECRKFTTLPEGGIEELKSAFFINRLASTFAKHKETISKQISQTPVPLPPPLPERTWKKLPPPVPERTGKKSETFSRLNTSCQSPPDLPTRPPDVPERIPRCSEPPVPSVGEPPFSLARYSWYHANSDRKYAEMLLKRHGKDGTFIIRDSAKVSGEYSLSLFFGGNIRHLRIRLTPDKKFVLGEEKSDKHSFSTVMELVAHYKEQPLHLRSGGETTLKFECPH